MPRATAALRGRQDLHLEEVGEEGVLHDRDGAVVHILNLTALFVWRRCDGMHSVDDIAAELRGAFKGTEGRDVAADVVGVLNRFEARGLLER